MSAPYRVTIADAEDHQALAAALVEVGERLPASVALVVVAPADTTEAEVAELVERLEADRRLDGAGRLSPVVDAVKTLDASGRVAGTPDRARLGHLTAPLAVRRDRLDPSRADLGIRRLGVV